MTTPNLDYIQETLCRRLQPSGWEQKLKLYLLGNDFRKVLEELLKQSQNGQRFTPILKQVFSFLENCPYNNLKVVMLFQDAYKYGPREGFDLPCADGMAASCSNQGKVQATLRFMYQEVQRTVYNDEIMEYNPNLKPWAEQGVLLMNSALTTEIDKIGMHYELWRPLVSLILEVINSDSNPCVFIFLGKKAQEFEDIVSDPKHLKISVMHPASAAYSNLERWNSQDCFVLANKFLKDHYNSRIIW